MEYDRAQRLRTDTMTDLDYVVHLSPVISRFMDSLTDHQLQMMQVVMWVSIPKEQITILMKNIVKIVTKILLKIILPKLSEVLKMDPQSVWTSKPGFFQELQFSAERSPTSVSRGEGRVFYKEPLDVLFEVDDECVLMSAQESLRSLSSFCDRCSSTSSCELSADIDISKTSLEAPSDAPSPRFHMQSCKEQLLDNSTASVLKNSTVNEYTSPHSFISLQSDGSSPTILSISARSISRTSSSDFDVLILPGISLLSSEIKDSFLQRTSPMIRGDGAKSRDGVSITTLVDCLMAALDLGGPGHFNTPAHLFVATRRLDDLLSKGTTHKFTSELSEMVHLVLDRRMIPLRSNSDSGLVMSGKQEHTDAHSSFAYEFLCNFAEESVKRLFMSCVFPRPNSASSEDLPSLVMPFNVTPQSFEVMRRPTEVFADMVDLFTTIIVRQIVYILCAPSDTSVDEVLRRSLVGFLQKCGGDGALRAVLNPQDAIFEALVTARRKQLDVPASSASAALPAETCETNSKKRKGIFSCLKMPKLNILKKLRIRKSNKVSDGTLHVTMDKACGPSHRTSDPGTSSSSSSISKKVKRTKRSIFGTMLSALRRCIT